MSSLRARLQQSKCAHRNPHLFIKKKGTRAKGPKKEKSILQLHPKVAWMKIELTAFCLKYSYTLKMEFKFSEERNFLFDFAIEEIKVAFEFEGGVWMKASGHNTAAGYTKDTDKYNLGQSLGWDIYRFTALNYHSLTKTLKTFDHDKRRSA